MIKTIKKIITGIFADWNGVQNIIAPSIMIFIFDENSFIKWITGIFTNHRFYIPMLLYLLFVSTFIFFGIKSLFAWETEAAHKPSHLRCKGFFKEYFIPYMLHMHKWLLLYLTLFMFVYLLKNAFNYFYHDGFPYMTIIVFLLRFGFISAFLYNYALIDLTIPIVQRGHTFKRAQQYLKILIASHPRNFLMVGVIQIIWIYISIMAFKVLINLLDQILVIMGLSNPTTGLVIQFFAASNLYHFILNVLILLAAFLVLNILYYPLILLLKTGLKRVKFTLRDIT